MQANRPAKPTNTGRSNTFRVAVTSPNSNAVSSSVSRTGQNSGAMSTFTSTGDEGARVAQSANTTPTPVNPIYAGNPNIVPVIAGAFGNNSLDGSQNALDIIQQLLLMQNQQGVPEGGDYTADFAGWTVNPSQDVKAKSAFLLFGGAAILFILYRLAA